MCTHTFCHPGTVPPYAQTPTPHAGIPRSSRSLSLYAPTIAHPDHPHLHPWLASIERSDEAKKNDPRRLISRYRSLLPSTRRRNVMHLARVVLHHPVCMSMDSDAKQSGAACRSASRIKFPKQSAAMCTHLPAPQTYEHSNTHHIDLHTPPVSHTPASRTPTHTSARIDPPTSTRSDLHQFIGVCAALSTPSNHARLSAQSASPPPSRLRIEYTCTVVTNVEGEPSLSIFTRVPCTRHYHGHAVSPPAVAPEPGTGTCPCAHVPHTEIRAGSLSSTFAAAARAPDGAVVARYIVAKNDDSNGTGAQWAPDRFLIGCAKAERKEARNRGRDDRRGGRSTHVAGAPREKGPFMRATVRWASKIITERKGGKPSKRKERGGGVRARTTGWSCGGRNSLA
ncbi:hypothetical protein B0H13DRAFT_1862393 [Mycena leptocephala]|nr:hypothetical protein B0H13DRAFT_1862393 [Mycena leptocephala]